MPDCDLCINGTTVVNSALIAHNDGTTGLICTADHEDSIQIRNAHKEDGLRCDPGYPAAKMLAPRYLRKGVRERVLSTVHASTPLHEEDICAASEVLKAEDVETVAISFVWSVLNPRTNTPRRRSCARLRPMRSRRSAASSIPKREYTRTATPVVNAHLAPVMRRHVAAVGAKVVNIESTLYSRIEKPRLPALAKGGMAEIAPKHHRQAIFKSSGEGQSTPGCEGERLGAGAVASGPAMIEEAASTIVVEPGWKASLHERGSHVISKGEK